MDRGPPNVRKPRDSLRISTMMNATNALPRKSPCSHPKPLMRLDCTAWKADTGPAVMESPPVVAETLTDEQLIARLRGGDEAAFDQIVSRYQDKVYGLALRLSGNASDAEEILQDAFLQVYRKIGQ